MKSLLIKPVAKYISGVLEKDLAKARALQSSTFERLVSKASNTRFGKDHDFAGIQSHKDFSDRVPIRDYEAIRPYVKRIINGERDVLWPGVPKYFAKTSGTTSGVKYIPITPESMPNHINSARNALFNYHAQKGQSRLFDGKMIFLSGSPTLDTSGVVPTGRLSGIVNHEVPAWIRTNQLPSYETNCIDDWEEKVEAVVAETKDADMRLISGIPPWVQMYFERLLEVTGKSSVLELFPNFQLFVHGGVNFTPYAERLYELIGARIDTLETYPASEGFLAFQDCWPDKGLRLNVNSGIFFEFVPLTSFHDESPPRLTLSEVETGVDYAVIINNNAGLWGYNIGDTVRFTSVDPPRLVVSGRVKHFISAFGEHVIAKEIEEAMQHACARTGAVINEFTVAPQVNPPGGQAPYHEWFVEFRKAPADLDAFRRELDGSLVDQNIYYRDLIEGKILSNLRLTQVQTSGFRKVMESMGKLGGQNKAPRLMNDRSFAEKLDPYTLP